MNVIKGAVTVGSLFSMLALNASALTFDNVTPNYNPTFFGSHGGGYVFGDIQLPDGTSIGSTPLLLDLNLTQDITLTDVGLGYNYLFGMGGFNPQIPNGGDAFTFSIELLENGTLITPDFATDLANPFTFGFDETNPFGSDVDNLYVSTSTTALASSLTFNEVLIQVSNSNPDGEGVTSFNAALGVNEPVPDISSTLPLLVIGLAAMFGFGCRKVNALGRQS